MAKSNNEMEAEELLDLAQEAINIGDKVKGKNLLEMAERLFPTQKAKGKTFTTLLIIAIVAMLSLKVN